MSLAAAFGMAFGAAGAVFIRDLAKVASAKVGDAAVRVERRSLGLFVTLTLAAVAVIIGLQLLRATNDAGFVISLALMLGVAQSAAHWADAYRVATRTDHVSSVWHLMGSLSMVALLAACAPHGLWAVVLVYFGCPALAQVGNFVQLAKSRKLGPPEFAADGLLSQVRSMAPVLGGSLVDYTRIFGAGAILALGSNNSEYSRYLTLVLLASRLTNPLSLIVRPLVPAYLDAVSASDARWLVAVGNTLSGVALFSLLSVPVIALVIPVSALSWVLPHDASALTSGEIASLLLFVWGQSFSVLLTPIFLAAHRPFISLATNAGATAVGVLAGGIGLSLGYEGSMLTAMGVANASASILLIVYVRARLLSVPPVRGQRA